MLIFEIPIKAALNKLLEMQAASQASGEIAQMLIAAEADINAKDTEGRTPLIIAAEFGNAEVAGVLIQARADVNAKDNNGNIDDFKFVDDFFKSQDAYVPAWGSSGRNNGAGQRVTLRVIGLDPEDIEPIDFIAVK